MRRRASAAASNGARASRSAPPLWAPTPSAHLARTRRGLAPQPKSLPAAVRRGKLPAQPGGGAMRYELYYWPEIQGRGEFVRLALEEGGARYVDVARHRGYGVDAMMKMIDRVRH